MYRDERIAGRPWLTAMGGAVLSIGISRTTQI